MTGEGDVSMYENSETFLRHQVSSRRLLGSSLFRWTCKERALLSRLGTSRGRLVESVSHRDRQNIELDLKRAELQAEA